MSRFNFASKVPPPPEPTPEQDARLDAVAREAGFQSRQAVSSAPEPERPAALQEARTVRAEASTMAPLRRGIRRDPGIPSHQISVKGPVVSVNRFIAYCVENNLPYIDAIDRLLDIAEGKSK